MDPMKRIWMMKGTCIYCFECLDSWNWTKKLPICTAWYIDAMLQLLQVWLKFTISSSKARSATVQELFVIAKKLCQWVSATPCGRRDSRFSVPDVKKYTYQNSGKSTLMELTSEPLCRTSSCSITQTLSFFLPKSFTTSLKSTDSRSTGSVDPRLSTHRWARSSTWKTLFQALRRRI